MTETPESTDHSGDLQPCSAASLAADEPTLGTAPHAIAWVALEQDGPWGAKAFTQSQLDPALGARIEELAAAAGVRPALIRTPGRHSSGATDGPRRVLVAHTTPGRSWLLEATVPDPSDVLGLDWEALVAGDRAAVAASLPVLELTDEPHLLVCTNGKRDTCCAVLGRPVARDAWSAVPGRVWETTHVSGHRFAATTVLLPWGYLHGRLDTESALQLLADADVGLLPVEPTTGGLRGRSTWSPAGQVAEGEVRRTTGEEDLDALVVADEKPTSDGTVLVTVQHTDGRSWGVVVEQRSPGTTRGESCGKDAVPLVHLEGRVVTEP
ncbi:sucrase ferredoxin [Nocardioides sp.]|uniref:sucrase ferredoxin n=1 Tax=Nocardioides sp. TaxID=35761 RepID=UPI00273319F1|nr:sucrase ferredoxin [Nocardioides sp.]MDP3890162.1 sucrase ferredoxin [Nocardioides sp.]